MNLPIPEPDPEHPDVSPEAIDQRLRHLARIYKLAMSRRNAKWLGPINGPADATPDNSLATGPSPTIAAVADRCHATGRYRVPADG